MKNLLRFRQIGKVGKAGRSLIILNLLAIALIAIINLVPVSTVARTILALPFLLVSPGYAVCAALWPGRSPFSTAERLALSVALSLPITSLVSLVLTIWGISVELLLYSVFGFILVFSVVAWLRRGWLSPEEDSVTLTPVGAERKKRRLYIALAVSPLVTAGLLGYLLTSAAPQEAYTEFYILGDTGRIAGYPQTLAVGEEGRVTLGITNHEGQTVSYRVDIRVDGAVQNTIGPVDISHGDAWEQEVGFVHSVSGTQKVEFLLYEGTSPDVYRSLYLLMDVR